jgi:hypothetical protein
MDNGKFDFDSDPDSDPDGKKAQKERKVIVPGKNSAARGNQP